MLKLLKHLMLFYVIKKVIYLIYVFIFLHWHAEFPAPLLQSSVWHDPSEINLIW